MATPRVQRQLIDIPRNLNFPQFCCLGVSQKALLPVTNRTAYGLACRFRLVMLRHEGKAVSLEQQSPFEIKQKLSIAAGATENLPVRTTVFKTSFLDLFYLFIYFSNYCLCVCVCARMHACGFCF
jgi:hypothetical protein